MSYTMTHLIIADQYRKQHKMPKQLADLFLLGTVCPDSIHGNRNFQPVMKERSHSFPEELPWGNIYKEEQMDKWYENIKEFYISKEMLVGSEMEEIFLKGYMMHLVVDIFNCAYFYSPNLVQYGLNVAEFRRAYREECLIQDNYLYQRYEETKELFDDLKDGITTLKNTSILENLGLTEEINVDAICKHIEESKREYDSYGEIGAVDAKMITKEDTEYFIKRLGELCEELLFDFPEMDRLFQIPCFPNAVS